MHLVDDDKSITFFSEIITTQHSTIQFTIQYAVTKKTGNCDQDLGLKVSSYITHYSRFLDGSLFYTCYEDQAGGLE